MAPTSIRTYVASTPIPGLASNGNSSADDLARVAALTQVITHRSGDSLPTATSGLPEAESEYEGQNMQTRKESFLSAASRRPPGRRLPQVHARCIPRTFPCSKSSRLDGRFRPCSNKVSTPICPAN